MAGQGPGSDPVPDGGPPCACPRPTGLAACRSAAAARERPRPGACHGASRSLRRLRSAALRVAGAWAMRDAAMAYTGARTLAP